MSDTSANMAGPLSSNGTSAAKKPVVCVLYLSLPLLCLLCLLCLLH
jgi:hypothetical protein